jgi:hypothetical protein
MAAAPSLSLAANALFPKVRQRVLAALLGAPGRSPYTHEVIGLAQSSAGTVRRGGSWPVWRRPAC